MTGRVLLYGATGYTGRKIARALGETELVVAGRDPSGVAALAKELKRRSCVFPLTDPRQVEAALVKAEVSVVLHAAGPFTSTARPMMDACLKTGVHYLDLCGEWPVFCEAVARDEAAERAGVMLVPGVGLTIAATDCLLAHAASLWPKTERLRLGVSRAQLITRGSMVSAAQLAAPEALIRRDGALVGVPAGSLTHAFDFGGGLREATAVSWADVVTGERSTGVRNIEVYSDIGWPARAGYTASGLAMSLAGAGLWRRAGGAFARLWPEGPSDEARDRARFVMVAEALDPWRRSQRLTMRTLDGYTASVLTAAAAVRLVLVGCVEPGFRTPSQAFGRDFVVNEGAAEPPKLTTEAAP
jgi:short subunit dehydrogenase-like uncharacterized protein